MDNQTFSSLVGLIYDAATDTNQWPRLLEVLSESFYTPSNTGGQSKPIEKNDVMNLLADHLRRALKLRLNVPVDPENLETQAAPRTVAEVCPKALRSVYRLTEAEARLVSALVQGKSINTVSKEFDISRHTARNQLKAVYEKTGIHRQAELIGKMMTDPSLKSAEIEKGVTVLPSRHAAVQNERVSTSMSRRHQTMKLPDGRTLGFAEYGAMDGRPVMLMHAANGSRLERHPNENIAKRCGVRLIVPDRPGVGLSNGKRNTNFLSWTRDVECLADHLRLQTFGIIGWSLGSAFAMAAAQKLRRRVSRLVIVSGIVPFHSVWELGGMYAPFRMFLSVGKYAHALLEPLVEFVSREAPAEMFQRELLRSLPLDDRAVLEDPAILAMLLEDTKENFRQRSYFLLPEILAISKPWGFDIEDIEVETEIWHGEADRIVPIEMAKKNADKLFNCRTHFVPVAGHFLLFRNWREILLSALHENSRSL